MLPHHYIIVVIYIFVCANIQTRNNTLKVSDGNCLANQPVLADEGLWFHIDCFRVDGITLEASTMNIFSLKYNTYVV